MGVDAGTLIAGRYRLDRRLGGGGMGQVWAARDPILAVDVALKAVRSNGTDTPAEQARALAYARREAAHAAALRDHPNIVAVHDVVEHDGMPWTVMRLVRGRSVQELLDAAADGLDEAAVEKIARGVLNALEAAHRTEILHRDIKPANIMVADDGTVLVTDFGIAKHQDDTRITHDGAVIGTVAYIAPERLTGTELPAGDLWSLGATLYHAITGTSPFDRDTLPSTLHAITHDQPVVPTTAGRLGPVIAGLLEKDPATRIGVDTARSMLDGRPSEKAPMPTMVLDSVSPERRRPASVLALAAVATLGLGAFAIASSLRGTDNTATSRSTVGGSNSDSGPSSSSNSNGSNLQLSSLPPVTFSTTPTPSLGPPGPDAELCNAATSSLSNAMELANIGLGDKNKSPATELASAAKSLHDGATEVHSIAANATVPAVKAKIGDIANDLDAMASAYTAQIPGADNHNGFDRKAADLSSNQAVKDDDALGPLCWPLHG
jgi:serine/threonine protein kinase